MYASRRYEAHKFENKKDPIDGEYKQCTQCHKVCLPDDDYFNMVCPIGEQKKRELIDRLEQK